MMMIDSCELVIHPPTSKFHRNFYLITKYSLIVLLLISTLSLISIIIAVFLAQNDHNIDESGQFSSNNISIYSEPVINKIAINIVQIRISLILIYIMIGFIAAIKDDLNLMLFFTFLSSIGILTSSLELNESNHRATLLISSFILPIISFFHCFSLFMQQQNKKFFYQNYSEA